MLSPMRATNYLGQEIPKKRRPLRSRKFANMSNGEIKQKPELVEKTEKSTIQTASGLKVVDLPYVVATDETLHGFGRLTNSIDRTAVDIVKWPGDQRPVTKGNGAGIVAGSFTAAWSEETGDCFVENEAVGQKYHVGFKRDSDIYTWYANYHPDGSQTFQNPTGEPFMVILAQPTKDFEIYPGAFVAFYVPGDQALTMDAGVWHQAAFPLTTDSLSLKNKQGKVHGVVTFDSQKEFGVHLRIKDAFKKPERLSLPMEFQEEKPVSKPPRFVQNQVLIDVVKASSSRDENGHCYVDIPLKLATPGSIHGFGHLFTNFEEEKVTVETWPSSGRPMEQGNEGGGVLKEPWSKWENDKAVLVTDPSEGGWHLDCGFRDGSNLYISQVDRRLDSNHVIRPCYDRPFVLLLSKHLSESQIKPNDFVAFYFDGSFGISIDQGIWRSVALPVSQPMKWQEKHGAVNASVGVEFHKEFGVFMRVKDFCLRPRY